MNSPIMSPFILYRIVAQSPFELSEILLVSFCFVCLIKSVLFLFCNSHWNPFIFQPTQIRRVCFSGFLPRRKFVIFGSVLSVMKRGLLSEFVQRWPKTYDISYMRPPKRHLIRFHSKNTTLTFWLSQHFVKTGCFFWKLNSPWFLSWWWRLFRLFRDRYWVWFRRCC